MMEESPEEERKREEMLRMYHACKEALSIIGEVSMQIIYQPAPPPIKSDLQCRIVDPLPTLVTNSKESKQLPSLNTQTHTSNQAVRSPQLVTSPIRPTTNVPNAESTPPSTHGSIKTYDNMKSLLNSNSPVVYVNKVPLRMLSSYESAKSMTEQFAVTNFSNDNGSFRVAKAFELERTSEKTRYDRRDDPNHGYNRENTHDLASLKKVAIHELQKSRQYLKFISNHLRTKSQHNSGKLFL